MDIIQLKRIIRKRIKSLKYPKVKHPWDLFKLKYVNFLEVIFPGESFCIEQTKTDWEVYYTERGSKFDIKIFENESEACEYFNKWLLPKIEIYAHNFK